MSILQEFIDQNNTLPKELNKNLKNLKDLEQNIKCNFIFKCM
jgi:hypothetical protein